jgi:hypothetical protein
MGGFNNISDWAQRCFGRHRLGSRLAGMMAGIVLIALMSAAQDFAETDEIHPDRSVSTSPTELAERGSAHAQPMTTLSSDDPPLTRAATQLRIDEMSPARWLSRFGSVSIGQRE